MLSEPGSPAITGMIPLCVPEISGNEWTYLKDCLDTNWVSSAGSYVNRFEQQISDYIGIPHAIATVNGTAALHIALLIAGVQPDDEVLVPTLTFIAPVNAIRYTGAWPVFMDADPEYWQMDPEKVLRFLDEECRLSNGELVNKTSGRRVKAILPVHILGHPCDLAPILAAAKKYGLVVVEDASESLCASDQGNLVGSMGDVSCFSFNGNKLITTGGGGMVVTLNPKWAERARYLTTQAKDDPIEYFHGEIGFNYRLTNIQAAMGVAQTERLEEFISKKHSIAAAYTEAFVSMAGVTPMPVRPGAYPIHWLYTVLLEAGTTVEKRREFIQYLGSNGIQARPLWHPIHQLPPYIESQAYRIEQASDLYARAVSLPSSVGLSAKEQQLTIQTVSKALEII